jgi:hypothetical protein
VILMYSIVLRGIEHSCGLPDRPFSRYQAPL